MANLLFLGWDRRPWCVSRGTWRPITAQHPAIVSQSQLSIQRSSANHSSPGELLDGGLDDLHAAGPPHVRRGEVGVGPRTWPIRGEECGHVTCSPPITAHRSSHPPSASGRTWRWRRAPPPPCYHYHQYKDNHYYCKKWPSILVCFISA